MNNAKQATTAHHGMHNTPTCDCPHAQAHKHTHTIHATRQTNEQAKPNTSTRSKSNNTDKSHLRAEVPDINNMQVSGRRVGGVWARTPNQTHAHKTHRAANATPHTHTHKHTPHKHTTQTTTSTLQASQRSTTAHRGMHNTPTRACPRAQPHTQHTHTHTQ